MALATDNVGNRRYFYIIICMNVPKQSQFDEQKWLDDMEVERSFENLISDLRKAPKPLRKTVMTRRLTKDQNSTKTQHACYSTCDLEALKPLYIGPRVCTL